MTQREGSFLQNCLQDIHLTTLCCCPQELLDLSGQLQNDVLKRADSAVNSDIIFSTYVKKCLRTLNLCQLQQHPLFEARKLCFVMALLLYIVK
jgi:hypothetical protein